MSPMYPTWWVLDRKRHRNKKMKKRRNEFHGTATLYEAHFPLCVHDFARRHARCHAVTFGSMYIWKSSFWCKTEKWSGTFSGTVGEFLKSAFVSKFDSVSVGTIWALQEALVSGECGMSGVVLWFCVETYIRQKSQKLEKFLKLENTKNTQRTVNTRKRRTTIGRRQYEQNTAHTSFPRHRKTSSGT